MYSRRLRNLRNSFDRNMVDKQVDRIVETGRQFVDGVSGAKPGKRRNSDFQGITSKSVKKVGRWVSDKVDLFFDDENDDWYDDDHYFDESREIKTFSRDSSFNQKSPMHQKRPLEALSLRQSKDFNTTEQKKLPYGKNTNDDEWPDELDWKVDRWQRSSAKENDAIGNKVTQSGESKLRNLPRSRRRRV